MQLRKLGAVLLFSFFFSSYCHRVHTSQMSDKTALAAGLKIIGLTLLIDYYYIYGKKIRRTIRPHSWAADDWMPQRIFFHIARR